MLSAAPMRGHRRGIRRGIWIAVLSIPLAAWLLISVWLASSPGRNWIASKIQRATGLESVIGRATLTPWSGLCLRQVKLLQPLSMRATMTHPLARIESVHVTPVWRSWLRGGAEIKALEFDSPQLFVPLEALAALASAQAPATMTSPPLAAISPLATQPASPASPAIPASPTSPTSPASPTSPTSPETPPATAAKPSPQTLPPTVWLHMKHATITLLSAASGKSWMQVSDLDASIPIAGQPAQAPLHIRAIQLGGQDIISDLNATLDWASPVLSLKPCSIQIHDCKATIAAKLAMLNGFPLQIEALIPRQPLPSIPLPAGGQAEAAAIAATARFRGLLLAPGSWQGELIAETTEPSARIANHEVKFDRGSAITLLNGGMLSCVDARLIGDDLSLLGNVTLLADGRAAAVLRLVAPPENAATIIQRVFPNNSQALSFTPLATPQRSAWDLHVSGTPGHLMLQLGKDGPQVDLAPSP